MSQKTTPPQLELPSAEKAAELRTRIVQDVFFAKMAEVGLVPKTAEEAESMWRVSEVCTALQQNPAVKQASAQQNPLLQAEQRLLALTEQYNFADPVKTASEKAAFNQVATAYAGNADVYKAMLALAREESQASAS